MLGPTLKLLCCVQRYVVDVTEETSSQMPGYVAPQRVEAAPEVRHACSLHASDGSSSLHECPLPRCVCVQFPVRCCAHSSAHLNIFLLLCPAGRAAVAGRHHAGVGRAAME